MPASAVDLRTELPDDLVALLLTEAFRTRVLTGRPADAAALNTAEA